MKVNSNPPNFSACVFFLSRLVVRIIGQLINNLAEPTYHLPKVSFVGGILDFDVNYFTADVCGRLGVFYFLEKRKTYSKFGPPCLPSQEIKNGKSTEKIERGSNWHKNYSENNCFHLFPSVLPSPG